MHIIIMGTRTVISDCWLSGVDDSKNDNKRNLADNQKRNRRSSEQAFVTEPRTTPPLNSGWSVILCSFRPKILPVR
jgi:hypothetical protein